MNRIGNLPVDLYSAICHDNTYIHIYCCSVYPQLPPVIGASWGYCGRGFIFPVGYGSVGVQLTRLCRLNQGTLNSECARKNLNATALHVTSTMRQSSRVFFKFLYRHKSEEENVSIKQYSSSSTNILYLNILYTNSGCGKREAHNNNWSMVMQRRHPSLELL